jgi:aspartate/methionine/tyrosine aminotransferase
MAQGVPGIPPQPSLQKALGEFSTSSLSFGYGPVEGELGLQAALATEMKTVYGEKCDVSAEDIALTAGCNMAFVATLMALADAGDEVILPVPW